MASAQMVNLIIDEEFIFGAKPRSREQRYAGSNQIIYINLGFG